MCIRWLIQLTDCVKFLVNELPEAGFFENMVALSADDASSVLDLILANRADISICAPFLVVLLCAQELL